MIGFGQDNTEFIQIQQEINIMKENLNSHHKQNKTGFIFGLIGGCSSIIGSSLLISPPLAIGGAALSLIGGIVMFDSHKWFGKKKMKGHFIIGKITNIILLTNDEVEFEVKLKDGNTVKTNWTNILY